ncbi:MAG: phage portal protein, partial [Alphaproteobacteria bacterium]|nr:phage portal protein [Alphaproteobacteria bacterium]
MAGMNFLDHLIGFFSPSAGVRRARARVAGDIFKRNYEAAQVGRRTEGWYTSGADANAEIGPAM